MVNEIGTASPHHSAKRLFGKVCQLVARRVPLMPGRMRAYLQQLNGVHFADWRTAFIGEDVFFDDIYPQNIRIGRHVRITAGTRILTHYLDTAFHPTPDRPFRFYQGEVEIGDYVFIGINTVIAKPVKIGDGAVIGANSVVTRNIPANAIVAGAPARVIGERAAQEKK